MNLQIVVLHCRNVRITLASILKTYLQATAQPFIKQQL